MYTVTKTYLLFSTERVTAVCGKQTEIGKVVPRTAIEAEILFAARVMQVRFLKRPSRKTPREQSGSGKKIGAALQRKMHIKRFLGKSMKADNKLKEQINDILSEWNPLDVPVFIASEEYINYVDSIINIGRDINALRRYFISLIIDRLGLKYDPSNLEQINSIENVIEKVMNALLKSGNV